MNKIFSVLAWVAVAACTVLSAGSTTNRKSKMSDISLHVKPLVNKIIVGEKAEVETGFHNEGLQAVTIPDIRAESPFVYDVQSVGTPGRAYSLSAVQSRQQLAGDEVVPVIQTGTLQVSQGQVVTVKEDIASFMVGTGFAPDTYKIVASAGIAGVRLSAQSEPLVVEAIRSGPVSSLYCPVSGRWSTIFVNKFSSGDESIFIRESKTVNPANGVSVRHKSGQPLAKVNMVATSLQADIKNSQGRWYAWIDNGTIAGTRFWGVPTTPVQPLKSGLIDIAFAGPGMQMADQSCVFLVVGREEKNELLCVYSVCKDKTTELMRVPVKGVAQKLIRTTYRHDNPGNVIADLAWVSQAGDKATLSTVTVDMSKSSVSVPKILGEWHGKVITIAAPHLVQKGEYTVDILMQPASETHVLYIRIPPNNPSRLTQKMLRAPDGPVAHWRIGGGSCENAPVLVQSGTHLLWSKGGEDDTHWKSLANINEPVLFSDLVCTQDGELTAEWLTASEGFRFADVR